MINLSIYTKKSSNFIPLTSKFTLAFLILLPNIINKFIFDYDSQKQVLGNNKVNHLDKNGILFFF